MRTPGERRGERGGERGVTRARTCRRRYRASDHGRSAGARPVHRPLLPRQQRDMCGRLPALARSHAHCDRSTVRPLRRSGGAHCCRHTRSPARSGRGTDTVETAGANFADVHRTDGSYLAADQLPRIPGSEVAGRTRTAGGCRRGCPTAVLSSRLPRSFRLLEIPDDRDAGTALALLVQDPAAWPLLRTAARLRTGETVVVHSAASGGRRRQPRRAARPGVRRRPGLGAGLHAGEAAATTARPG